MGASRYCRNGIHRNGESSRGPRSHRRWGTIDRRFPAIVVAVLTLLIGAACRGTSTSAALPPPPAAAEAETDFTQIDSPSLQFLPRHEEVKGWRLEEDPIVVPGATASVYLGAAAAQLTPYELIDVTAGKYVATGSEGFATVEIFRFPDFVKAFGAYSIRKDAARAFISTGNEGYVSKYAVHIWRGPFYIRVTGGGAENPFEALTSLASSVAERMPAAASKPAVFNFFPTDSRIQNSERYSAEKGLGIPILVNSFQAHFQGGEEVIQGLIIPAANKAAATKILDAYRELYVRNGKLLDPITNLGEDNFTGEDRFMGRTVAFRLDRFVIVFNGFRDRQRLIDLAVATDTRILGSIRRQLVGQDERAAQARRPSQTPAQNQPPWAQPQQ